MKIKKVWPERIVEIESPEFSDVSFRALIRHEGYSQETYGVQVKAEYEANDVHFVGWSSTLEKVDLLVEIGFNALKAEAFDDLMGAVTNWPKTKVGYTNY